MTPKTVFGKPSIEVPLVHLPVFIQRFCSRCLRVVISKSMRLRAAAADHKIFEKSTDHYFPEIFHYLNTGWDEAVR